MAIPVPRVGYPRLTAPFATSPSIATAGFVRLACLIHAANVRSEPGSNPSKYVSYVPKNAETSLNDHRPIAVKQIRRLLRP